MCLIYGDYVPKPVIGQFVLRLKNLSPIIVNKYKASNLFQSILINNL